MNSTSNDTDSGAKDSSNDKIIIIGAVVGAAVVLIITLIIVCVVCCSGNDNENNKHRNEGSEMYESAEAPYDDGTVFVETSCPNSFRKYSGNPLKTYEGSIMHEMQQEELQYLDMEIEGLRERRESMRSTFSAKSQRSSGALGRTNSNMSGMSRRSSYRY
ncbi:hypothetical protein STCU_11049 [Strigomonas culicis]|uniref:Uncharacterized protein n=1 Tax=Strigomonas culicis TaxID=28005 RepID=S9UQ02_9TRYP|nr:hypothetical protein STCU_11049 [Strigomonas culicis]|eukprot:EPY16706.1 hypothetical protein STCU_11049 [Strigomonas culicis]